MKKKKSNKKIIWLCMGSAIISTAVIAVAAACGVDRSDLSLQVSDTIVQDNNLYVHASVPYQNEHTIQLIKDTNFNVVIKSVKTDKKTPKVYANKLSKALVSSIQRNPKTNQVDFYLEFPKINDKYKTITDEIEVIISPNKSFKLVSHKYSKELYKILDLEASNDKMAVNSLDAAINFNVQNATQISIQTILQDMLTKEKFTSEKTSLTNLISCDVVFKNFLINALNNDIDAKLDLTNLLFANLKISADKKSEKHLEDSTLEKDVRQRALQLLNYIGSKEFDSKFNVLNKQLSDRLVDTYDLEKPLETDKLLISLLAEFIGGYDNSTANKKVPYGFLTTKYIDLYKAIDGSLFAEEQEKTQKISALKEQIKNAQQELIPSDLLTSINKQKSPTFKHKVIDYIKTLDTTAKNDLLKRLYRLLNSFVVTYQYDFLKMEANKLVFKPLISKKIALVDALLLEVKHLLSTNLTSADIKNVLKNKVALGFPPLKELHDKLQLLDQHFDSFKQKDNQNVVLALQEVRKTFETLILTIHKTMQLNDLRNMSIDLIDFFTRDLSSDYQKTSDEQTNLNQLKAIQELLKKPDQGVESVKELITQNKMQEKQGLLNNLLTELKNKKTTGKEDLLYTIKRSYLFVETKIYNADGKHDPALKQFFKSPNEKNEFIFEYNLKK
ncbi:hypothetical protein [Ureaplasma zalophigenitalium]|uniref:Lipoprotein n=1 Tax=Ureaplasma zalophigenitalium TaxID=907723 RepID=A0ABT3BNL1_9BACT|nr:hypothetical protein [Ureaplasma zalophigenitalium]MCV3753851.1 hypothetical protein [Ureaplasma zalophigenitalium]